MCLPTCLPLPATKTHAKRACLWQPAAPGSDHAATLTITQGRKADSYRADVQWEDGGLVLVLGHTGTGELYAVRQAERGWTCHCEGFRHQRHCKHQASAAALCDAGAFETDFDSLLEHDAEYAAWAIHCDREFAASVMGEDAPF